MYEHRSQPLLHPRAFVRRLAIANLAGVALIALSLAAGMAGYHGLEGLSWTDAFLNASMILSGMGPLHNPQSEAGKIFAGVYALYSGLAVILIAGVMFGPVVHRLFHKFHVDLDK